MSETLHTFDMWPSVPQCGADHRGAAVIVTDRFRKLPRSAQCASCLDMLERCYLGPQSASPAEILSVSLFLGGLSGWLPAAARDLVALVCADPAAVPVLLDLAEDHASGWARVEVEWPTRDAHGTGDNPHVWLAWRRGDEERLTDGMLIAGRPKRCPCGVQPGGDITLDLNDPALVDMTRRWLDEDRTFRREYLGQWVPHERCPDCGAPMNAATSQSRAECSDAACRQRRDHAAARRLADRLFPRQP